MESHADDHLRGMAFHEAGHAVVAWSLNLRVESIYIREIGAGNSATKTDPPDHLPLLDQLAMLAAGVEAERAFKSPLPEHAGVRDRLMAITLVLQDHEGLASDEIQSHLTAGHSRARELLLEHRDRVIRVAERLRDARQIDAAEFLGLMSA
jgi:ATP-dependent Zn protease